MIINSFLSSKVTAAHFYHTEYYIIVKLYKLYLILILFIFNNENSCFFFSFNYAIINEVIHSNEHSLT